MMTDINSQYTERYSNILVPLAKRLESFLCEIFEDTPRIDRISARAKSIERFVSKSTKEENGNKKYNDPLNQIQDQLGARIVVFYRDDVDIVSGLVESYFRPIEFRTVVPDSDYEFAYFGRHYILLIPDDVIDHKLPKILPFFELQIKTLFQHAWSEANHDLGYKPSKDLPAEFKRKIAFTSAQAWGADQIFNDLHRELE
ncbi:MAG: RelA/SpoT domain-containing protein [Deltaproteobacteria bacterium]|nr:RelA/SpoT domain-containing protein [Deltaproteobacteria bacterium]